MSPPPRRRGVLERLVSAESLSFFRHTRSYLSAGVLQKAVGALLFPLLTELLSPADYGLLSIYASLVSLLTIVSMLNLHGGLSRYFLEGTADFDEALGTHLLFLGGFNVVVVSLGGLLAEPLGAWCGLEPAVFQLALIVSAGAGLIEVYLSLLTAQERSARYGVVTTVRALAVALGTVGLAWALTDDRYLGRVYTDLVVTAGIVTYAVARLVRQARLTWNVAHLRYSLRFSLPLLPHSMARFALGYIDRIIIQQLVSVSAAGLYAFAYDVGTAMSLVVLSMGKAWRPIFIREYHAGAHEKLDRMVRDYARQVYLVAVALMLFAADGVRLIIREAYHPGLHIVPIVVLGYVFVFLYTLFFQYSAYRRRTELISLYTVLAGATNVGLNYALVPRFGLEAAAWTTLASYALLFGLHYANARFVLRERVLALGALLPGLAWAAGVAGVAMAIEARWGTAWAPALAKLGVLGLSAWALWGFPRGPGRRR